MDNLRSISHTEDPISGKTSNQEPSQIKYLRISLMNILAKNHFAEVFRSLNSLRYSVLIWVLLFATACNNPLEKKTTIVTLATTSTTASPSPSPSSSVAEDTTQLISINSGNSQISAPANLLAAPLAVIIQNSTGLPVSGVLIDWTVLSGGGALSSSQTTTGANGIASVQLTLGGVIGANTVQATIHGATDFVTFTETGAAGVISAAQSTVVASPTSITANGTTTSTVTVTLKDSSGNPVSGKIVTLASSRGATDTISAASGLSSVSGIVTFTVKSTTAGSSTYTATDSTDSVPVTQTAAVAFTVGAVSASLSTVAAGTSSVTADGTTTSTITVTLKDSNSNPVSGKTVTLASSRGGTDTVSAASGTSSASGVVTFTVKSSTVGSSTYTATDSTDSVAVTQTAAITFTAGAVSASLSTVSAGTSSITANGTTTSTITVTLRDSNSNLISGKTVTLASSRGGTDTVSAASGTSSASGVVTFTVKSTTAGSSTYTATDSTDSVAVTQTAAVAFTVGAVSASLSTVSAGTSSITADGTTTSTITVTLKDSNSNPVSGKTVTLASSRGGTDTVSAASGSSSASGVVTFTVKSSTAGSSTYTATDSTDSVTVTQTAAVTFTAGTVSASLSTVSAGTSSITADGTTTSTVTVTLKDSNSNPVSGKTVTLASSRGGTDTVSAASGTSSASGVVTFTVKSTTTGSSTYTATDSTDSVTVMPSSASVTFTAGTASTIAVSSGNNQTGVVSTALSSAFVAIVKDANGNVVSGVTVDWAVTAGAGSLSSASNTTSASGLSSSTLTLGASAGTNTATATINGTSTSVTFTATSYPATPPAATSPGWSQSSPSNSNTVTASWTKSTSTILTGQKLQFYSDGTCTTPSGSQVDVSTNSTQSFTGSSGVWSYQVITTDSFSHTSTSACSSTMTLRSADLTNSTFTSSSSSLTHGQTSTLTVTLKDSNSIQNTVGGYTVTFSASTGSGVAAGTFSSVTDNSDGTYTATFTATTVGTATTITATVTSVGALTQTRAITVINATPVISATGSAAYPLPATTPPVAQGNSVTLATTTDADGDTVTVSCTYQTLGLNASDPNYAAASTNCNTLPTLTTSGSPTTTIIGTLSSSTGSLTWTPTTKQRGTYQFTISATDGVASATNQTATVTVIENLNTTNLLSSVDALNATSAGGGLGASIPSAPFTTSGTAGVWLNLISAATNGALTFGTVTPWAGTGQSSTSTVDPYRLTFTSTSSDDLSLGTVLNGISQIALNAWIKPTSSSTAGRVIASNASGTATTNGFQLRQSTYPTGRAEFTVGQKYYSYKDVILTDHPLIYYRFNETSGTTATSLSSPNNTNGTYAGTVTLSATGALSGDSDTGVSLSGSGYISASTTSYSNPTTFSQESWFKVANGYATGGNIVGFSSSSDGGGGNHDRLLWMDNLGKMHYGIYTGSTTIVIDSPASYNDGNWHHVVGTFVANSLILYVDGVAVVSNTTTATNAQNYAGYWIFGYSSMGSWTPLPTNTHLVGSLDEGAIYDYVLTPTQVLNHYNTGLSNHTTEYPGNAILADLPWGYWRLNEKSDTTAYDSSGNGRTGTYQGTYTQGQTGALTGDTDTSTLFDGSSGVVNLSTGPLLSEMSAEAWINFPSVPSSSGNYGILTNTTAAGTLSNFFFEVSHTNNLHFAYHTGSAYTDINGPSVTWTAGTWYHVAVSYKNSVVTLYVNGVSNTTASSGTPSISGSNILRIGAGVNNTNFFPGTIDEVALYNYALSPTQVINHYNSGSGAAWRFCQSQTQMNSSNWNMLSAIYNGTTAKLFVNGQQECSVTPSTTYSGAITSTHAGSLAGSSNFWSGVMSYLELFGASSAPVTTANINSDFSATANRFRQLPVENIVTSGLVLHLDAANAKQGLVPYSNGCATTDLSWFDISSGSINATLNNFATCGSTTGWYNTGSTTGPFKLMFDGTNDYATVSLGQTLSSYTFEAWTNPSTLVTNAAVISQSSGSSPTLQLGSSSHPWVFNGATAAAAATASSWVHVVGTQSGTASTLYINGVSSATNTGAASVTGVDIGRRGDGVYYTGGIGVVRVYSRALSLQEIKQNCLAQQSRYGISSCASP